MGGSNWTSAWYTETFYWDQFPLWVSPRDSIRVTGSSPRSLVEVGQLPLMQIGAGWCFWHKVFILLFSSACSRMLRTPNPMPKQLDTSCTGKNSGATGRFLWLGRFAASLLSWVLLPPAFWDSSGWVSLNRTRIFSNDIGPETFYA